MDSLPEQHIDSLPKGKREEAYEQVRSLFVARMNRVNSEEELSNGAGFHSVEATRNRLAVWGFSGLLPQDVKASKDDRKTFQELQAKPGRGPARKLPDISSARVLFQDTINTLLHHLDSLAYHKDVLWGGKFYATDEIPKEVEMLPIKHLRDDKSPEEWNKLCSDLGEDPESTVIHEYRDAVWSKGASHFPRWEETCLITAVLMDNPQKAEWLLQNLHLEPAKASREEIRKLMFGRVGRSEGLYATARNLSRLIRGADNKQGRNKVDVDPFSQAETLFIHEGREKGLSDEEIRQKLGLTDSEFKDRESFLPSILPPQYESKHGF